MPDQSRARRKASTSDKWMSTPSDVEELSLVYCLGRLDPPGLTERLQAACADLGRIELFYPKGALMVSNADPNARLLIEVNKESLQVFQEAEARNSIDEQQAPAPGGKLAWPSAKRVLKLSRDDISRDIISNEKHSFYLVVKVRSYVSKRSSSWSLLLAVQARCHKLLERLEGLTSASTVSFTCCAAECIRREADNGRNTHHLRMEDIIDRSQGEAITLKCQMCGREERLEAELNAEAQPISTQLQPKGERQEALRHCRFAGHLRLGWPIEALESNRHLLERKLPHELRAASAEDEVDSIVNRIADEIKSNEATRRDQFGWKDVDWLDYVMGTGKGQMADVPKRLIDAGLDQGREVRGLDSFVVNPAAAAAGLDRAHILALRLFTSSVGIALNEALRNGLKEGVAPSARTCLYPTLVLKLLEGVERLMTVAAPSANSTSGERMAKSEEGPGSSDGSIEGGACRSKCEGRSETSAVAGVEREGRGRAVAGFAGAQQKVRDEGAHSKEQARHLWHAIIRPVPLRHPWSVAPTSPDCSHFLTSFLERGGVELSFLSASLDRDAVLASAGEDAVLLLRLEADLPGADLSFLSVFPHAMETCFPPCVYLRPSLEPAPTHAVNSLAVHACTLITSLSISKVSKAAPSDVVDIDIDERTRESEPSTVATAAAAMKLQRAPTTRKAPVAANHERTTATQKTKESKAVRGAPKPTVESIAVRGAPKESPTLRNHRAAVDAMKSLISSRKKSLVVGDKARNELLDDGIAQLIPAFEATTLVCVRWLLQLAEKGRTFPAWQQLPPEALARPAAMCLWTGWGLPIAILSYPWAAKHHPDPEGFQLRRLRPALHAIVQECNMKGGGTWGVAVDFMSLPQRGYSSGGGKGAPTDCDDRSASEKSFFQKGLKSLNLWYVSRKVYVLMLTASLPETAENRTEYNSRGWCHSKKPDPPII
mgnify:CR=1 FL=1